MPWIQVDGRQVETNEEGFLVNFSDWDEEVTRAYARLENLAELTEDHWMVIYYIRDYYGLFKTAPMIRKLCKETGFTQPQIEEMFPHGPIKNVCKLAGLPKPAGCI